MEYVAEKAEVSPPGTRPPLGLGFWPQRPGAGLLKAG